MKAFQESRTRKIIQPLKLEVMLWQSF